MVNKERGCIYTCLIGEYERLNELDVSQMGDVPRICFTDNPSLRSESWTIKHVEPVFPMDSVRSQRRVKMLAHEYLVDFDVSLYVDNSVCLKVSPERLFEAYLDDADMALLRHSFRESVLDEFMAVSRFGLDEPSRIFEQLNHYQLINSDVLWQRPHWGAIILRRHHVPAVRNAMQGWYEQVMRYSRRDQLSFNMAVADKPIRLKSIDMDNHESWFHRWPVLTGRDDRKRSSSIAMSGASLLAQERAVHIHEMEHAELRHKHDVADRDQKISELQVHAGELRGEIARLGQELASKIAESDKLNQTVAELNQAMVELEALVQAFKSSASWRLTHPLREIRRRLGGLRE